MQILLTKTVSLSFANDEFSFVNLLTLNVFFDATQDCTIEMKDLNR
jgi:hypothetical protein